MYSDSKSFIEAISKIRVILKGRNGYKILYGKIADIIPIDEKIREIAEAMWRADEVYQTSQIKRYKDLNAPLCLYATIQKQLDKCCDFETWLKKSTIGSAFRNIWGKKGML